MRSLRSRRTLPFAIVLVLVVAVILARQSQAGSETTLPGGSDQPTLVVFLVVDQLRADLLDRYAEVFTGGFARLLRDGHRFTNATFDHSMTATAPGHATAATGTHPYRHGLVGNDWREQNPDGTWSSVYALRQTSAPILGSSSMEGRGPENLLRSGIGDWVRAAHPGARIVSLSGKDRSAIAMAGQGPGEVYWFDSSEGRWITSGFYRDGYPDWIDAFNTAGVQGRWAHTVWESTVPGWAEALSRPDTFPHEGDGVNTWFPHHAELESGGGTERELNEWRGRTPHLDVLTLDLARVAVGELDLGRGESVDYLALALSQVDRVGHDYGPLSREQLDTLVRLDRELGSFLEFLDHEVGEGRWLLGLTADHGVLELPEARSEMGLPGERIPGARLREMVTAAEAAWNHAGGANAVDSREPARAAAAAARGFDFVEDAFSLEDVLDAEIQADSFHTLFARSYRPERAISHLGHLQVGVRLGEGVYVSGSSTGTGHGSPYHYDRHVPFILLGPGVVAGVSDSPVSVVDLAPTLSSLAGIPFPDDLDGRVVLPR